MGDSRDTFYVAEVTLNKESHHVMVLQGGRNKRETETAMHELAKAHTAQHPNLAMDIVKLHVLESPEQVDKMVAEIKGKYPNQRFADELFPDNPNALFFEPLDEFSTVGNQTGRADEALIRMLCGG